MFYSQEILTSRKKGGFGVIWLAATLGTRNTATSKKLSKKDYLNVNVNQACQLLMDPPEPMALRLTGSLMVGLARVYFQQFNYFYNDVNALWQHLLMLNARDKMVEGGRRKSEINMTHAKAKKDAITVVDQPMDVLTNLYLLPSIQNLDPNAPLAEWNMLNANEDSFWLPAAAPILLPTSAEKARNAAPTSNQGSSIGLSPFAGNSNALILSSHSSTPYPHDQDLFNEIVPFPQEFDNDVVFPAMEFDDGYVPIFSDNRPFQNGDDQEDPLSNLIGMDSPHIVTKKSSRRSSKEGVQVDLSGPLTLTLEQVKFNSDNYVKDMKATMEKMQSRKRARETHNNAMTLLTTPPIVIKDLELKTSLENVLVKRFKPSTAVSDPKINPADQSGNANLEFDNTIIEAERNYDYGDFFDGGGVEPYAYNENVALEESSSSLLLPWEYNHQESILGQGAPIFSSPSMKSATLIKKRVSRSGRSSVSGNGSLLSSSSAGAGADESPAAPEQNCFVDYLWSLAKAHDAENNRVSFLNDVMAANASSRVAASAFYNILVLSTQGKLQVCPQPEPFSDIVIQLI